MCAGSFVDEGEREQFRQRWRPNSSSPKEQFAGVGVVLDDLEFEIG